MQAPEFFMNSYYSGEKSHFAVDDLLNFPNEGDAIMTDGFFDSISKNCADSPAFTATNHSYNSSSSSTSAGAAYQSFADSHDFSTELCVPYDDMAELEWLSNFVDESYSMDPTLETNLHMLQIGSKPPAPDSTNSDPTNRNANNPMFQHDTPLPGKARSKRSRAAPGNWTTRLLNLTPSAKGSSSSKKQDDSGSNPNPHPNRGSMGSEVRRCLHCATEKTPQWRTGPMGPKTLCNACGVRYKSGRLVPEYRPAASPTFVPAKHSNSHRKVVELRRQREMHVAAVQQEQFIHQGSIFGGSNGGDEFLIHHQQQQFRHMI
ncbi:GATA transcription factor 9 [Linum perenne]